MKHDTDLRGPATNAARLCLTLGLALIASFTSCRCVRQTVSAVATAAAGEALYEVAKEAVLSYPSNGQPWRPGVKHPKIPGLVTADKKDHWKPAPNYMWVDADDLTDLRVRLRSQ